MPKVATSLGLLISVGPDTTNFRHALALAEVALGRGMRVFWYCVDEGVLGLREEGLLRLKSRGLKLLACAYGARRHQVDVDGQAVFSGLAALSDIMAETDAFVSFN